MALERALHALQDSVWALTSWCCSPSANVKLNGRTFKIVKLLGEGGFSFVYLAEDPSSGRLYALKKIGCPLGSEDVKKVTHEVEAYRRFRHPNIIRCLDTCSTQDPAGDGKIFYLFLPYYSKGNLQDAVNAFAVNGGQFAERDMLRLFLGTAKAVQAMHQPRSGSQTVYPPSASSNILSPAGTSSPTLNTPNENGIRDEHSDFEEEEGMVGDPDSQDRPLMGALVERDTSSSTIRPQAPRKKNKTHTILSPNSAIEESVLEDSQQQHPSSLLSPQSKKSSSKQSNHQPWAHRDLKPANIMIDDEGNPILMDFGSALPARIDVPNRSVALYHQDLAAEHCSMPYRAPELFDVKTDVQLTESVDIWSLGCILFCLAYGHSPFETSDTVEQGGSIALAVMNGSWKFPSRDRGYSETVRDMITKLIVVDSNQRPTISQVISMTQDAIARVS